MRERKCCCHCVFPFHAIFSFGKHSQQYTDTYMVNVYTEHSKTHSHKGNEATRLHRQKKNPELRATEPKPSSVSLTLLRSKKYNNNNNIPTITTTTARITTKNTASKTSVHATSLDISPLRCVHAFRPTRNYTIFV